MQMAFYAIISSFGAAIVFFIQGQGKHSMSPAGAHMDKTWATI